MGSTVQIVDVHRGQRGETTSSRRMARSSVLWAKKLVQLASEPGDLDDQAVDYLARILSSRLPAVVSEVPIR